MNPQLIDNRNTRLVDDLKEQIQPGSKLDMAAACFSIYAYEELKEQLEGIEELRFIFTSPTFVAEKADKQRREFYIPRLGRERSLTGNEFEVRLRNQLSQKAIARECADWIRRKCVFKSNVTNEQMMGFLNVDQTAYAPLSGFTTADLGCERGNMAYSMIQKTQTPMSQAYLDLFGVLWQDQKRLAEVTKEVLDSITAAYQENAPELIYFITLYNIFSEFLSDISEDVLPNELTGFKDSRIWQMLYNFQHDAALAIINKLEKYNGCILADSVGLGKTFTALAVIKYYESRNKSVLVLCPKKLQHNWNTFKDNYKNNPIAADRLNYDVLFHTDLNRKTGYSNGLDLSRLNWSNYDLLVIDESHNFRNGGQLDSEDGRENRYQRLMNEVIRKGVKTRVLMLSATPVNNRFVDLRNQLALAYEGNPNLLDKAMGHQRSVEDIFRKAQQAFNRWSKLEAAERSTARLLSELEFDFFELLDAVTIARSRKHIEKYYDTKALGSFPERLKPLSMTPPLTDLSGAIGYNEIFEQLMLLTHAVYTPTHYILASRLSKYEDIFEDNRVNTGFTQAAREQGIRRLTAINLMKRMESSVYAFDLTLHRIQLLIGDTLKAIHAFREHQQRTIELSDLSATQDFDEDDQNADFFTIGQKVRIELADMDHISWEQALKKDQETLALLRLMIADINPQHDSKLQALLALLTQKVQSPLNPGNHKVLLFTAFADTAAYLYEQVGPFMKEQFGLHTAMVTGSVEGRSTVKGLKTDLNTVLTCFSPISKDKALLMPDNPAQIDVLIATDCISEGQNLQDCDYVINYDIHWNPVRIIQRFGRIDRIGSHNEVIQLVNFWPNISLEEYINLRERVESKMKIVTLAATGDDNVLNPEEKADLQYRQQQLQRLRDEVVDMEDMQSGVSILDLGLNEFRLDLLSYIKEHQEVERAPLGLHAVVAAQTDIPPGTFFVLKNKNEAVNIDRQNRLHPFYLVYVGEDGSILADHLDPRQLLARLRLLCKGQDSPNPALTGAFNRETKDGRDMKTQSQLLEEAVLSIVEQREESDLKSFLHGKQISFKATTLSGLDDFELVCFLVVRKEASC